jgi:peptidoglycan glycosyltransferase
MNAPLRRIGIIVMIMFGLLFANLNWVQAYKADELRNSPYNTGRVQVAEYQRQRGPILVGPAGTQVAVSVETDGRLRYLRTYPEENLYAHVVGYKPVQGEPTGIEAFEQDFLAGTGDQFLVDRFLAMFSGGRTNGGTVQTTLLPAVQETAFEQLRNSNLTNRAAVVALDPTTGAVQALVSLPSFDPNPIASHNVEEADAAFEELSENENQPLRNRVLSERFEPGSTFKVIDSAAALASGDFQPETVIEGGAQYTPPTAGQPIGNAPGVNCPNELSLADALRISCNTAFSRLAAEELGSEALIEMAEAFGFGDEELEVGRLNADGIPVAASVTGEMTREDGQDDPPTVAQSAIGQASVQMTPVQGALVAATVANGGVQMRPYLVERLQDAELRPVYRANPEQLRRPVSPEVAAQLREMMVGVVQSGTGTNAQIENYVVGGKTGTAQNGPQDDPLRDHGWFIGFMLDGNRPVSAVAVFLQNAGDNGSSEAARIGGEVMRAVLGEQGGG